MDPVVIKRYNSQESMGTHYSRTTGGGRTRRDSDSSIDKVDLEKIDRLALSYSVGDVSYLFCHTAAKPNISNT